MPYHGDSHYKSHWLAVRHWWRVEFEIASLVYQVLSSKSGLRYLSRLWKFCSLQPRSVMSSSGRKCSICHSCSQLFWWQMFCCSWTTYLEQLNSASLRDKEVSCTEFRKQLKTFMFQTNSGASWLFWLLRIIIICDKTIGTLYSETGHSIPWVTEMCYLGI